MTEKLNYLESYLEKMGEVTLASPDYKQKLHFLLSNLQYILGSRPEDVHLSENVLHEANYYLGNISLPLNEGDEASLMVRHLRNYCERFFSKPHSEPRFEPVMNIQSPFLHIKARQFFDEVKAQQLSSKQVFNSLFFAKIRGIDVFQILVDEEGLIKPAVDNGWIILPLDEPSPTEVQVKPAPAGVQVQVLSASKKRRMRRNVKCVQ